MRAFIAVKFSGPFIEALTQVQNIFRQQPADVKWVETANLHLTLKFLGEIPENQLQPLSQALAGVASRHQPFTISLGAPGAFPNWTRPRVFWVGVLGEVEKLLNLQGEVEQSLTSLMDLAPEAKRFSPHLTMGRMRERSVGQPWRGPTAVPLLVAPEEVVREFHLIKSELSSAGPIYTVMETYNLG